MKSLSPVVWSEGMHLAPHHFQAQSRYFEDLAGFGLGTLFYKPYGLIAAELDAEALLNGTVAITHARGIMPDGLTFNFPADPAPEPIAIRETFSPTRDSHLILLAIPARRAGQADCIAEGGGLDAQLRYRPGVRVLPDETTGRDEKPVAVALKNFRLILDLEDLEGLVTLPLARVRRDGAGHFIYDPEYIPPSLRIGASRRLMELVERLAGILDAKAEALLAERRGSAAAPLQEYAAREIASYWLSHAIHSGLAPLRHHLMTASAHPEALFGEFSRLAGALCTFSLNAHPRDLPLYDHDHLGRCFGMLDRQIRDHLELVGPSRRGMVPLQRGEDGIHRGRITDARDLARARWFLGVRASVDAATLAAQVPRLVKTCSALHVARLVRDAYPGLPLEHLAAPPPEIAPRPGTQYFGLGQAGPCWKSIADTHEVGVYVPDSIPDAEIEVTILHEP